MFYEANHSDSVDGILQSSLSKFPMYFFLSCCCNTIATWFLLKTLKLKGINKSSAFEVFHIRIDELLAIWHSLPPMVHAITQTIIKPHMVHLQKKKKKQLFKTIRKAFYSLYHYLCSGSYVILLLFFFFYFFFGFLFSTFFMHSDRKNPPKQSIYIHDAQHQNWWIFLCL